MSSSDRSEAHAEESTAAEYRYERGRDESPSEAVVAAVADVMRRPVMPNPSSDRQASSEILPPVYDVVDPDSLDTLVDNTADRRRGCTVTFTYCNRSVTVNDGVVTVSPTS